MIGRRIGSWILERELGRGGMGSVYEARHVTLRSHAAVKVLSAGLESEELFRQRFHREADLQAQLRHPNVARILDYLEDGGQWFLVVEYLDRGSLSDRLAQGARVSRTQALAWARQALAGLGHAHAKGIVHRDVKPANLLLGSNDEIVVADFGIARAEGGTALTRTGIVVGTPQYMSPEQIVTPDKVDWRSDIYSLGIVLYELLAGRKPFDATSQFAVLHAHVSEPPPPLRTVDPSIPPEIEAVVTRALAKKPEDRYPDCATMIRDLDRAVEAPALSPTAAVPPPVPTSGTVHASALFVPAMAQHAAGPSPGELRDRRRSAFLRRLAACAVAIVAAGVFLAFHIANGQAEPRTVVTNSAGILPRPDTGGSTATETTSTAPTTASVGGGTGTATTTSETTAGNTVVVRPDPGTGTAPANPIDTTTRPPIAGAPIIPPPLPPEPPPVVPNVEVPPIRPLPEHPQIAVVGTGSEPLLAGALEQQMENRFAAVDEHADPAITEILQSKGGDVAKALGPKLLENGFHVLILLRVEEAERRTQTLRGMSGSVMASRMRMNAYLLPANRPIGRGWTELVEYTELSAVAQANRAFIGPTADLRKAIADDWTALRAAAAARAQGGGQ